MTSETDRLDRVVELWRRTFGGPPPVLVDPALMLALIAAETGCGHEDLWREVCA